MNGRSKIILFKYLVKILNKKIFVLLYIKFDQLMNKKKAIIIGAGFSGLSAANYLAKGGFDVTVLEKNSLPGGRARKFEAEGFIFDMGPSWYWMPDVFDKFFDEFGKSTDEFYQLKRLDPSYSIVWGENDQTDLPADFDAYCQMFENLEKGSSGRLKKFLNGAEFKYRVGVNKLVYKKSTSPLEFADPSLITGLLKLDVFKSFHSYIRKYFSNPKLLQMLEFPVLFLGGTPKSTPALYSLMNFGDIVLGTWYPDGGIYKVVEGMVNLAESQGVTFKYNEAVSKIAVENGIITKVHVNGHAYDAAVVIGSADYNHVEQELLPDEYRTYSSDYWNSRVLSPSSIIFYLGINKEIPSLKHHTLFFDEDFDKHAEEIYKNPQWPDRPSIYISNTSKSDSTVAPAGMENLMVLIPVAPGLEDNEETRDKYYNYIMDKLDSLLKNTEGITGFTHRIESFALASTGDKSFGAMVFGILPQQENEISGIKKRVSEGEYIKPGSKGIMIGKGLASNLDIGVNDTLILLGQGYHGVTAAGKYHVVALLDFPINDMNNRFVYLDMEACRDLYDLEDKATSAVIMVKNPYVVDHVISRLKPGVPDELVVLSWKEIQAELENLISGKLASGKIVKAILFMVIGFGIWGTIIMLMSERKRELGIMIAVGVRKIRLIWIVAIESFFKRITLQLF